MALLRNVERLARRTPVYDENTGTRETRAAAVLEELSILLIALEIVALFVLFLVSGFHPWFPVVVSGIVLSIAVSGLLAILTVYDHWPVAHIWWQFGIAACLLSDSIFLHLVG